MTASFLRGLGRFVGLLHDPRTHDPDHDRLGHLIVNEAYFVQAYQHLGRRQLRKLCKEYGLETYSRVYPEVLTCFLEALMGMDPKSKAAERTRVLLEAVIRILIFQRDKQGSPFSLYRLIHQLSLRCLVKLASDTSVPRNLRDTLNSYLESLPGLRDAMFFNENIPVACYAHHQIQLKAIQGVSYVLDKRALVWFKRELDVASDLARQPDMRDEAYRKARHLIDLNRTYWVMDEEDFLAQLLIRGCITTLNTDLKFRA
ncbi:hypothetical protein IFT48_02170 [Pseudomonas fluorescens]|uniref:hypothetical protein n=1 Tax=Pseudomonas TaxID=286 RepID=UPI000F0357A4|nr:MULTISPECIES: hypothetical protein [Pseudomonas]MBD8088769.1 hypothetical protein [Pseudomonas fluorescens]